jgi:hypothetical protein
MTRPAKTWFTTLLVAFAVGPGVASAQMRGGGLPATPVAVPLDKVPVGTWAEYSLKRGEGPGRTIRHALVGREQGAHVIETRSQNMRGDKILTRSVLATDPTQEGGVKKVVVQMGTTDPMELPVGGRPDGAGPGGGRGGPRWIKPDPKTLVGKETVKVPAGSFQTEHHRTQNGRGQTIDYWVAKEPGPFGLVKMEMERGGGPDGDGGGKVIVELAARGKDAKPELTRPAKPFDPEVMRARRGGEGR